MNLRSRETGHQVHQTRDAACSTLILVSGSHGLIAPAQNPPLPNRRQLWQQVQRVREQRVPAKNPARGSAQGGSDRYG